MTILSQEELKNLMAKRDEVCVSIYLPTEQAGPQTRQNPIRFKNLLTEAENRLTQQGLDATEAKEFLQPARELDAPEFWRHQNEGLAIFIARDFFRYYRLPLNFEDFVVASDRLHLKPLMPLFASNGKFFILALSQNEVRLFQGTRFSVSEIFLNGKVPQSLAEALKYDDPEAQLQAHTGNPNPAGGKSVIYHGQGVGTTDNKNDIWRYCQKVDAGLQEILNGERSPLVLAGVEYLLSIYKDANSYQNLMEEGISGNPENLKPEELHQQGWQIVEPYFHRGQEEAVERYRELAGNDAGKTSRDLEEIVKAAYNQRIDSVFVIPSEHQWGRFDPKTNTVELHPQAQSQDEDLFDFASVYTFLNGGNVYTEQPEQFPEDSKIAAILRY